MNTSTTLAQGLRVASSMKALCLEAAAVALFVLAGCTSALPSPPPTETVIESFVEQFVIGAGDSLNVNTWASPELTIAVPVRPDGRISMPLVGDVLVGGLTPEAAADRIQEELGRFVRDPQVSVIVVNIASTEYLSRVRVTGAVRNPSSVPFRQGMTVLDIVLDSGGLNEFANAGRTRLFRSDGSSFEVDLAAILERGDLSTNYSIRPGDVITVPESAF